MNRNVWLVIFLCIGAAIVKLLFIDVFYIPSESMMPFLKAGDLIMVKKTKSGISRNDCWVIKDQTEEKYIIKRIVALPSEKIQFSDNRMVVTDRKDRVLLDTLIIDEFPQKYRNSSASLTIFPHQSIIAWDLRDFGPFLVPMKNMKLKLTVENYLIYKSLIETFEKTRLDHFDGKFFLDGKEAEFFVFKQDYYFILGDNYFESNDSRFFGPVPEQSMHAKYLTTIINVN